MTGLKRKYPKSRNKKISLAMKKNNPMHRKEVRDKVSKALKGKKLKKSTIKKMIASKIGKPRLEKTKQKISKSLKNHLCYKNAQRNKKISIALKKNPVKYWLGKKRINMMGNKFALIHGKSKEPYSNDWTETLKKSIRERDHYQCQLCGKFGKHVHHINYNKKNCDPINLITLCHCCHMKTNRNREHWEGYFVNWIKAQISQ